MHSLYVVLYTLIIFALDVIASSTFGFVSSSSNSPISSNPSSTLISTLTSSSQTNIISSHSQSASAISSSLSSLNPSSRLTSDTGVLPLSSGSHLQASFTPSVSQPESVFSSASLLLPSSHGSSTITPGAVSSSSRPTTPFPITSSLPYRFNNAFGSGSPSGPRISSGSAPINSANASMDVPYIAFGCTTVSTDPWHDERSCRCQSQVSTWYATQSAGMLTTTTCRATAETTYGQIFPSGCSTLTETQLATSWSAPASCCGYCAIAMPTVRLVFWAPATAASNLSTIVGNFSLSTASTVVDDGFTFTSPSVYVIYTGAAATASCVAATQTYHQVGGIHTVTLPYNSADLSSVACINSLGSGNGSPVKWAPINYSDLYYPIPMSESLARVSRCFTDPSQNGLWGNYMQNPFISIPQDISNVDPAWTPATCTAGFLGAMDPPRALHPAVSMVPIHAPANALPQPQTISKPAVTALPGQPIPAPIVAPMTAPTATKGSASQNLGAADPGKGAEPDPGTEPAPVEPFAEPNASNNDTPPFQFGSGQGSPDPNDMSPAQLSALHQALQPSPVHTAANDPASNTEAVAPGDNTIIPDTQVNPSPDSPAGGPSNQPADIQLQPISSAIFDKPTSSSGVGKQGSTSGDESHVGSESGSEASANGGSPDSPQVNAPQTNSKTPEGNSENSQAANVAQDASVEAPNQAVFSHAPNGGLAVGSSTIVPGQIATINDHQVSVGSYHVAIDGNTYAFAASTPPTQTPITIGGLPIQAASNGGAIIGGSSFAPGAEITTAGHAISVGSSNIVIDGKTQILPTAGSAVAPPIVIGGTTIQRDPNGAVIIGGSTLAMGARVTISGHAISVGAANLVVDGTTNALPTPAPSPVSSPALVDGQQMQRAPNGGLAIGSITIAPGAQTTIGGHTISVGPSNIVMDSNTYALPTVIGATVLSTTSPGAQRNAITLPKGSVFSAGGVATISGQIISVLSNDQGAVIGGSTVAFAPTSVFTVGGQTFTAAPTGFAIAGTSVVFDGPAVTISGTVLSLGPSGLQIGSSTVPLTAVSATGLAGYILSAFDTPNATSTTAIAVPSATGVTPFTGIASKTKGNLCFSVVSVMSSALAGGMAFFI